MVYQVVLNYLNQCRVLLFSEPVYFLGVFFDMFFFWSATFFYTLFKNCLLQKFYSVYLNGNKHFTTYLHLKKTGFTLYSCFRMFIQSHLLFQLSGITQIFRIPTFQKLVWTENCWDSLPEGQCVCWVSY